VIPALAELQRHLGITRVADITGLDNLGIPVVQAVRPFSRSNAVSQGKGATLAEAARSAVMESAESFFAEQVERFDVKVAPAAALGVDAALYGLHAGRDVRERWGNWDMAWVASRELLHDAPAMVPLELVHTAYVLPPPDYDGVFTTSTTGLAVSDRRERAVCHGLLECIERDAIARALGRHGFLQTGRIDPNRVQSPELDALLARLASNGFIAGFWLAPAVGGVPVVWCHVMEDCDAGQANLPNPAEGSAARMTIAAAAIAAVLEAAQSRLAAISGARDDIGRASYNDQRDRAKRDAHRRLIAHSPMAAGLCDVRENTSKDADAGWLLSQLRNDGIAQVHEVAFDTRPLSGLHAVKIVVPQLRPLIEGEER
jgi:ribosomal protein S12 methylthiotransferase accessory factor